MFIATLLFFGALALTSILLMLFKDYRFDFGDWFGPALASALLVIAATIFSSAGMRHWAVAAAFALALLWLRARRVDADFGEGIVSGAIVGGAAAVGLAIADRTDYTFPTLVFAGTLAGTIAYFSAIRLRRGRFAIAVANAVLLAFALRWLQHLPTRRGSIVAISTVAALVLLATFLRWPMVRRELTEEAALGFVPDDEVTRIANPFRRLMPSGWIDQRARRAFVRLATEIATRKAQQRRMSPDQARLHQLEVLRIRRLLQDVYAVELSMRRTHDPADESSVLEPPSDTLRSRAPGAHPDDAKG